MVHLIIQNITIDTYSILFGSNGFMMPSQLYCRGSRWFFQLDFPLSLLAGGSAFFQDKNFFDKMTAIFVLTFGSGLSNRIIGKWHKLLVSFRHKMANWNIWPKMAQEVLAILEYIHESSKRICKWDFTVFCGMLSKILLHVSFE